MAYNGTLITVGNYTIPMKYISHDSYKVTRNTQDLDSYRDANGLLHRNALALIADKVEFETPYLWNNDVETLFAQFKANYTSQIERKASVTVYVPEMNVYTTQDMYFSNPDVEIYYAGTSRILYKPIRIAFIGYGVAE